jgi:hypothetical protein
VYGDGPSSYEIPQSNLVGHSVTSVVRVQPPQVHQHLDLSAAAWGDVAQAPVVTLRFGTLLKSILANNP